MNEENKVELDTDDVQEQNIDVAQEPKEEKVERPEVDLGYTDPIKKETKSEVIQKEEEPKEEKKEDNLQDLSDNVQKRIDKLTRKYREAERREKAALDYAKGLQKKYETTDQKLANVDSNYFKEFEARVDAQREQVKGFLKTAIENNDTDKIMETRHQITNNAHEKEHPPIPPDQQQQSN